MFMKSLKTLKGGSFAWSLKRFLNMPFRMFKSSKIPVYFSTIFSILTFQNIRFILFILHYILLKYQILLIFKIFIFFHMPQCILFHHPQN